MVASGKSLTLGFKSNNNIGSRLYLLKDDSTYQSFKLLGNEFSFDVDVSTLGCGINAALYHVGIPLDGGKKDYGNAGAAWGMGYGDAQCARDLKFIAGKSNRDNWKPDDDDPNRNTGQGDRGSCAVEMDLFEGNSISTAFTLHPCKEQNSVCTGDKECGGTYSSSNRYGDHCSPDGADFATFRRGNTDFYGKGLTVDSSKPYTVVTQFPEEGGSLKEVVRFYVQDGKRIDIPKAKTAGLDGTTLTEASYKQQKALFGEKDDVTMYGGWAGITKALSTELVLVFSLWDDGFANMLWLDGVAYPKDKSPTSPGVARGTCALDSGKRTDTRNLQGSAKATFSNIKFGPIGSTNSASGSGSGTSPSTPATTAPPASTNGGGGTTPPPPADTGVPTRTTNGDNGSGGHNNGGGGAPPAYTPPPSNNNNNGGGGTQPPPPASTVPPYLGVPPAGATPASQPPCKHRKKPKKGQLRRT